MANGNRTMTDTSARPSDEAAAEPEQAPATAPAEATPDPLVAAVRESAELKDKLLRALAEMENLRRRTEREVADARFYGVANLARDMLSVADNLASAAENA